jgi:hypothetical protein
MGRAMYQTMLAKGKLVKDVRRLRTRAKKYFGERGLSLEPMDEKRISQGPYLNGLYLAICKGNKGWQGLVVGFPGTGRQLATAAVGTPYMRRILYPILRLYEEAQKDINGPAPCLYLLGTSFSEVWLRKFRFFQYIVPHVIVLPDGLKNSPLPKRIKGKKRSPKTESESDYQNMLTEHMERKMGLTIKLSSGKSMTLSFLGREVPTSEGTKNPERLDLLAYDSRDHSLVAFEIKGPKASQVEKENLFFQGMEHRDWLEKNKMGIKFAFDKGPKGRRISTKKRVKLVLGCFDNEILKQLSKFDKILHRDKHLEIEIYDLKPYRSRIRHGNF